MPRRLPSLEDAAAILAAKRTRPVGRPPPVAGRSITALIRSLDQKFGRGPDGLAARWREIVGEKLATQTEPVKLTRPRGGGPATLELKVGGPAAALIQHQAPDILARVNLFLGEGAVGKLRIVQGVLRPRAARGRPASRRALPPLDAAAEADLEAGLAKITDEPLRAELRRLGREVLRRGG